MQSYQVIYFVGGKWYFVAQEYQLQSKLCIRNYSLQNSIGSLQANHLFVFVMFDCVGNLFDCVASDISD